MDSAGASPRVDPAADAPQSSRGTWIRLRNLTLGAKLILFSTLLTVAAVCVSLLFLSVETRRQTKALLANTLAHHQQMILHLQQRSLEQVLRTSTLMTDSPTLRAAMETYASEADRAAEARPDLLATIQREADRVAAGLGRDLLVVTGPDGVVLAANGSSRAVPTIGSDFSERPIVRHALAQRLPVGGRNYAVLELEGEHYQVGSVPIVFQGFVIGTLTLGDRIDQAFVERLQQSFACDFVVAAGQRVLGSTLRIHEIATGDVRTLAPPSRKGAPIVASLGDEDYVAASLPLGPEGGESEVTLYLLHSLTSALGRSNHFFLLIFLLCGSPAILLAGAAAWWTARSILRPLGEFVSFMRSVAVSGDHTRRYARRTGCVEVETLQDAYDHLMGSLQAHEERLLASAREELDRLERLKESEKLAALGRMLSSAAHEINNPLTGVVGNVELLLRGDGLDPATRLRLERVSREGQRIVALVRSLLRIAHRDTGQKAVVDLHHLIREAAQVRRHEFTGAGIRVEIELDPEPLSVLGSELELQQVFLNIINNAYDALLEVADSPRLTIRTARSGDQATIILEDNGPGIKSPTQVFDHFYTTKPVGKGTGLGLSISHAIVRGHDGQIVAANRAGGGAQFTITLPLTADAAPAAAGAPALETVPAEAPLAASVLIVDDEPTIVDLQTEILESLGAAVMGVRSGSEAIALLQERRFDLIVTDLRMPGGVSGKDLFLWAQANQPATSRGFVFVTGDTTGEAGNGFLERAGAPCLLKPFSMTEYVRVLRETLHETRPIG